VDYYDHYEEASWEASKLQETEGVETWVQTVENSAGHVTYTPRIREEAVKTRLEICYKLGQGNGSVDLSSYGKSTVEALIAAYMAGQANMPYSSEDGLQSILRDLSLI
jgi:hypothetical protein